MSVALPTLLGDLKPCSSVLLAGAGGGYDVLGAVPIVLELEAAGHRVHVGSLSFSDLNALSKLRPQGTEEHAAGLWKLSSEAATEDIYCPEAWLASWLSLRAKDERVVWAWHKSGVRPLQAHFDYLHKILSLDAIVLIDGGIDLILRGDESSIGTPAEDLTSLAAARRSTIPIRRVSCLGLGAELRDGIQHEQVFFRISELTRLGGYRGASSLVNQCPKGSAYRDAVEFVFAHQTQHRLSHVHRVILDAMAGEFGASAPHVWLSPLLNIFWHFDLDVVADSHLFLEHLAATETIADVTLFIEGLRKSLNIRPKSLIPI